MKRIIFMMVAALVAMTAIADKQCPRCHGAGKIVAIPEVGNYGVERTKKQCPICGGMYFSGHRCTCPDCGGSGRVAGHTSPSDREGSASDRLADQGRDFNQQWLSVHEYSLMQNQLAHINDYVRVEDECTVCGGTGKCKQCGGVRAITWDADIRDMCRVCGGDGFCIACRGKGTSGGHIEYVNSPEQKEIMAHNVKTCNELASLRAAHNVYPDNPNGPQLGIDSDGRYYIKQGNLAANESDNNSDFESDSDSGFFNNSDSHDSDGSGGMGRWLLIIGGGAAVLSAGIFLFSRFRG